MNDLILLVIFGIGPFAFTLGLVFAGPLLLEVFSMTSLASFVKRWAVSLLVPVGVVGLEYGIGVSRPDSLLPLAILWGWYLLIGGVLWLVRTKTNSDKKFTFILCVMPMILWALYYGYRIFVSLLIDPGFFKL